MKIKAIKANVDKSLRKNSPTILTGIGVSGVLTTAYLAGKASFKLSDELNTDSSLGKPEKKTRDVIKEHWKLYIPTALSAGLTVGCIIYGARIGSKRAAAAYSLLTVSEKAFSEYKEKVVEKLGDNKERALRDEIAQDRINKTHPESQQIVITGAKNVLCCELHTGRYFNSDMESLRKAENQINSRAMREMYAVLSDFYCIVGLPYTAVSDDVGWDSDRLMELKFTTTLTPDGQPCLAFDYNYIKPI